MKTLILLACLGICWAQSSRRGVKIKSEKAAVELGKTGDVVLRRQPGGSLAVDAKFLQVKDLKIGTLSIEQFIEQAVRKRIKPHIKQCQPGYTGAFCDQKCKNGNPKTSTYTDGCKFECKKNYFFNGKTCLAPIGAKCNIPNSNKLPGASCKCNQFFGGKLTVDAKRKIVTGRCDACGLVSGFNADLASGRNAGKGWSEITNWRTTNNNELYENAGEFHEKTGRFYPKQDGYFLCNANVRLDSFTKSKSYSRLLVAINGKKDVNNGLHTIEGNGGSTNYRSMMVSGTLMLKGGGPGKGQYASIYVYSQGDNSYHIQSESGFSCHQLDTQVGFHAEKNGNQKMGKGWREITKWRTDGTSGLYSAGGGFNGATGRYSAPKQAIYYCYAMVRMDSTSRSSYFRLNLNFKGQKDVNNGFHAIRGNKDSTDYGSLNVAGTIYLNAKEWVSVYVFSQNDNSWEVHSESGWGCHMLGTKVGFHADLRQNLAIRKRSWLVVKGWRTNGNRELYSMGPGGIANGYYMVPYTGFYACAAQIRIDSANNYYFRMTISINNQFDTNNGFSVISGNEGSSNYRTLRTAGVVRLVKGNRVSVSIYSGNDNSYTVQSESGFSCNMLKKKPPCPKCNVVNSNRKPGLACKCKDGYSGKITWKDSRAYGTCTGVPCDVANSNKVPGTGCKCKDGYIGKLKYTGSKLTGKCTPAPCTIPGSNKLPGPACKCLLHYGGKVIWRAGKAVGSCTVCGVNSGFNADLKNSKVVTATGWKELADWRTKSNNELYETNNEFNNLNGRFTPKQSGYFLCNANVRLDGFTSSGNAHSRLLIAINGKKDTNNGLHTIEGNGGSTNYRSMTLSGNLQLTKGQYASVWVYSKGTRKYTIQSESGFSCHRFSKATGFHAEKDGDQKMKRGYQWISNWRVTGTLGLYNTGGGFTVKTGYYRPPVSGAFYCSTTVRFDGASTSSYFRLCLATNGGRADWHNGLCAIRGNKGSSNYGSLNIAGSLKLNKGQWVAPYTYASNDNSWTVHTESGWGCHIFGTMIGFHADTSGTQTFTKGWSRVLKWRTSGNNELYAMGLPGVPIGVDAQGFFNIPDTGYYACSAQLRFDAASGGYFRIVVSINGQMDVNSGLHAISGNKGSTNFFTLRVAGTSFMKAGDTISVNVYSQNDNYYRINSESGFSCHKFTSHYTSCPACAIPNSNKLAGPACKCNPGFAGKVTWKGTKASGKCTKAKCNIPNSNKLDGAKCKCKQLYVGDITWGEKGAEGRCIKCGPARGFNADLRYSSPYQKAGFYEIKNWRTNGNNEMFESDGSFNEGNGRFYPKDMGYFLCNANVRLDGFTNKGSSGLLIAINGKKDVNNGMYTIEGNGGSTNYRSMMVTGTIYVPKGKYVSVFVQSIGDNRYRVQGESGFSCNVLNSPFGFHADKDGNQAMTKGWKEVSKWRVSGTDGLYTKGGFNIANGRYVVSKQGAYYCYANVRMDNAATSTYFRLNLNLNGGLDVNNGFHAIRGNKDSTDKGSLSVAGTIWLKPKNYMSVYVYSHGDTSWTVNSQSGWGCHRLGTGIGFHAAGSATETFKNGWITARKWKTSHNNELYAKGGATIDKYGRFIVPSAGYYICAAQVRIDAAGSKGYFRVVLSVNNAGDINNGAHMISGNMGSTNYRSMRLAAVFRLKVKESVSVKIYNNADTNWRLHKESGFSCHKFWQRPGCPACKIPNSNKMAGSDCMCKTGFTGKITWKDNKATGVCKPQACNIPNSNKKPGTACACAPGFAGKVTWKKLSADPSKPGAKPVGTCKAAACDVPNSNKKKGPTCACNPKFSGAVKWVGAVPYGACNPCGSNRGFNADLMSTKTFRNMRNKWHELTGWRTNAKTVLYESSREFNNARGRFQPQETGYYFCSANVRLDGVTHGGSSYTRLLIAISGKTDVNSGLAVIEGNGGSTNYRSLTVSGNIQITKGQYVSVFVFANADNDFRVQTESGFSCHRFSTKIGFGATKNGAQVMKRGWKDILNWRVAGVGGKYSVGGGFTINNGRYTVPSTGVYYCTSTLRMDQATAGGYFRLSIVLQNGIDVNNGLSVIRGNRGSTNYGSMGVSGSIKVSKKQYLRLYTYSSNDNSWRIQSESSWGCHQMGTHVGFHADLATNVRLGKGWSVVNKWRTAGNNELYAMGGGINAQGFYTAPEAGYYVCATQLRLQSTDTSSYFRLIISINNKNDVNAGLHVIEGNRGSTNYRAMRLAGTTYLKKGDRTAVSLYSQKDTYYFVQSESGFSCHKFVTPTKRC